MKKKENLIRHNWTLKEILVLFDLPFNDLLYKARQIHLQFWQSNQIQMCTILNIKTGSCSEDCKYCAQSAFYNTGLKKEALMEPENVFIDAKKAKANGAQRYCMGAAWRKLHDRDLPKICQIISKVKSAGLETCMTLGMLTEYQAKELSRAGLEYYNHNLDTSLEYYHEIITTRTFQDRLDTIKIVRDAGIKVCCGGIFGMGEKLEDRASLLKTLANLSCHPESTPLNMLVHIPGTPLEKMPKVPILDFVKAVAVTRILMPKTFVRLSGGRISMGEEGQALCFFAGANSIHFGEKLLTTPNPTVDKDMDLFARLGLTPIMQDEMHKC